MENVAQNNRRIARNTALLYVRMFITLAVALYTSRIVLEKSWRGRFRYKQRSCRYGVDVHFP